MIREEQRLIRSQQKEAITLWLAERKKWLDKSGFAYSRWGSRPEVRQAIERQVEIALGYGYPFAAIERAIVRLCADPKGSPWQIAQEADRYTDEEREAVHQAQKFEVPRDPAVVAALGGLQHVSGPAATPGPGPWARRCWEPSCGLTAIYNQRGCAAHL